MSRQSNTLLTQSDQALPPKASLKLAMPLSVTPGERCGAHWCSEFALYGLSIELLQLETGEMATNVTELLWDLEQIIVKLSNCSKECILCIIS